MTCKRWEPLLSQFLDGELNDSEGLALEKHLESCEGCGEELASFRRLSGVLATHIDSDPAFVARFRVRRDREFGMAGSLLIWKRLAVRLLPLAAAALLGASAAVWLSVEEEGLIEVEARELGNGISMLPEEAESNYLVLQIALEPFPGGGPP